MEFVKPAILKYRVKRIVMAALISEVQLNLRCLASAVLILDHAQRNGGEYKQRALMWAPRLLQNIRDDRYLNYCDKENTIVYEIDKAGDLSQFYKVIRKPLDEALRDKKFAAASSLCRISQRYGESFISAYKLPHPRPDRAWYDAYSTFEGDLDTPVE